MQELQQEIMGTMARDTQRRNAQLNQLAKQRRDAGKVLPPRPHNPNQCGNLELATQYRHQVIREISHLMSAMSNKTLTVPAALREQVQGDGDDAEVPEFSEREIAAARSRYESQIEEVRQMNADINKMIKSLSSWDRRVVSLGGAAVQRPPSHEHTIDGVTYFGAARNLPEYVEKHKLAAGKRASGGVAGGERNQRVRGPRSEIAVENDNFSAPVQAGSNDVAAAYADSEGDDDAAAPRPHGSGVDEEATGEEYAALLGGNKQAAVKTEERLVSALLCLGGACCAPPLAKAASSVDAIILQLDGLARIGDELPRGTPCPICGGDAQLRQQWASAVDSMDRRTTQLAVSANAAGIADDDEFELEPFTETSLRVFALSVKKEELRRRLAQSRQAAAN